ncbi:hypothetical protein GEU84_004055 [Fertoebacter nigrum]|uniref:Uncharacterized protein n=1 Tax=Fertoeibacter niger TaxID=2656921 RepID=A0A8X8GSK1_9RHOB|nr:hypothetical protein [Fertoeibacter niger]NUB43548.1 hypothetical protein [Fertoeibacter niger]
MGGGGRPFRRRVFYIPGYDPFHPRRYRELYRKEAAAQAAVSGYDLALTPKKVKGPYGWRVTAEMEGQATEADVEVLVWSDIVRGSMQPNIAQTYLELARTAWAYIGSGALFRLMRLRKGPIIAALYPIVMLVGQLAVACLTGWGAGGLLGLGLGWLGLPAVAGLAFGVLAGLAVAGLMLRWFRRQDGRFMAYYLMHDYSYAARTMGANTPEMEARMAAFTAQITQALHGDYDEVLVVGHSSGAHIAVSVLADAIRAGLPARRPALALLTLGQVVPMVSFLPDATRLRADLHYLAARDELTWVDVTAPGDGCAFALCDPVAVSGCAPPGKRWPLVISAAFTQSLSPARWKALRWRFFRLHFQYLCAFDRPRDYDYFRITAGPMPLALRYAGRAPSKSRIDRAVSGYVSRAA